MPRVPETEASSGCSVTVAEFDFEHKIEKTIELADLRDAIERGHFLWIDVDFADPVVAKKILTELGFFDEEIIEDALTREPATQTARYENYLHFVVSGCRLQGRNFDLERVDCVMSQKWLVTIHKGPVVFLQAMKKDYRSDFVRFARSPSFLVYEIWDHLIDNYLAVQKRFEDRVEALQHQLMGEVNDAVFEGVSELGADLLHFRKVVLPARSVLTDLSTRKSLFISEATQPFLANMVGTLERVLQDLLVDRDILSNSLNLYMSMVGHRTNEVMKKLTVVSVIFLPLTFLCGVYGMNFDILPELRWRWGYLGFWLAAFVIVSVIVVISRRARLL
jgi:magnesium transporter